jgi:hypothetical protein
LFHAWAREAGVKTDDAQARIILLGRLGVFEIMPSLVRNHIEEFGNLIDGLDAATLIDDIEFAATLPGVLPEVALAAASAVRILVGIESHANDPDRYNDLSP